MRIEHRGQTDVGKKREHNEDSFLENEELGLFAVADGMGGHAGGGIASRLAVEVLERNIVARKAAGDGPFESNEPLERSPLAEVLRNAVEEANTSIFRHALRDPALAGMGTTLTALLLHREHAFFGHVGDSRAYLIRDGVIDQITEDHSMVQEQVRAGLLTEDEARTSRFKNVITRSVGFEERVHVDVMAVASEPGDTFVLCSDGLTSFVEDSEIAEQVARWPIPEVPEKLIDLANERGGEDNITVVVVRI